MKYLFRAFFSDGTSYTQTCDDVSEIDPTKSAFYDVLQRQDDVALFELFSDDLGVSYFVDLRTGHFEVGDVSFNVGKSSDLPPDVKRRLIYFRKVRRHFNAANMTETGVEVSFNIGWQCTYDGKNFQETIEAV